MNLLEKASPKTQSLPSLFVCPHCGYTELPCWRTSNYRRYSVIARIDEIDTWDMVLARRIREAKGEWIFIEPYWYKLSLKSGVVNRTTPGMGLDEWKTHGFTEKPKRNPTQRMLLESQL